MSDFLEQGKHLSPHLIMICCITSYKREKDSYLLSLYKNKKVAYVLKYIVPNFQCDKNKTDDQNNLKA